MKTNINIFKRKDHKILRGIVSVLVIISLSSFGIVRVNAAAMPNMSPMLMPGATPDYFGTTPNYANSPLPELDASGNIISGTGIRKFVDSLPGLGAANANDLGQYIPVAVPDITKYPGSDYYEIELRQYTEQLHKDLPATTLRGYVQVNTTDPKVSKVNYLGPMILAQKDRPVRVKFTNKLPTGSGGNLFLPVDTTAMGAGMGPVMDSKGNPINYTENRATIHLHGAITPWISDGNPHQWITPAGEATPYPAGVSVHNVPDMPDPGPGSETFFYTNQQSARMMFYHDHSYGITRLNVYAGEAAGYILQDKTEQALIAAGTIPSEQIPLIIQDKTFVPNDAQLIAEDPTWDKAKWGGLGNLWFPHVYMPNQNPGDISGANTMGRWDYGPWFWPPYTGLKHGPVDNPLFPTVLNEPAQNPGTPNVSLVPEAYMDTPLINGTAYPFLNVEPKAYRFRILNNSNDRFWNLQLYTAKSNNSMWSSNGSLLDANAGEVSMVPAVSTKGFPATWPTDGRDGGVPDPATVGPNILQIGTESGFLPAPAELINQPINYNYNRRDIVVLNIANKTLLMGPAERADVIIDFSKYAGKTLILYNDSPAPVPAFDPRYDYYTGDPDQTDAGGAPTTKPGYGPNTRTIMQIKVSNTGALSTGYPVSSIVSTSSGAGYTTPTVSITGGGGTAAIANAVGTVDALYISTPGTGYTLAPTVNLIGGSAITAATSKATISVSKINTLTAGSGYTSAPTVGIIDSNGGVGKGAISKSTISVSKIDIFAAGSGYTSVPTVTILDSNGGTGKGATANATIDSVSGNITGFTLLTRGAGYTSPVVTITGGGFVTAATAKATGSIDSLTLVTTGKGYTSPVITLTGGGFVTAATAKVTGVVDSIAIITSGSGYLAAPTVTLNGGGYEEPATAKSTIKILSFNIKNVGNGYTINPTVTIKDTLGGTGTGATATATIGISFATLLPAAFAASQNPLIVPAGVYARIQDTSLTFTPVGATKPITIKMQPKAIQELFETDYGRMNATMGVELPNTNVSIQTTIPYGYIDPVTEAIDLTPIGGDGTQIWKITHNGVDTHSIHFHLFDAQLINRVGWDGAIRPPDPNETGIKDTVRMNPLEDVIIALRPIAPKTNFGIPDSIRPMDVTMPLGSSGQFLGIDINNNPIAVTNQLFNYGWEYMWHCHLLGHEENDMMRPITVAVTHAKPTASVLSFKKVASSVKLTWTDPTPVSNPTTMGNPANEIGFKIERAIITKNKIGAYKQIGLSLANATSFSDTTASLTLKYSYRVNTFNATGNALSNAITVLPN